MLKYFQISNIKTINIMVGKTKPMKRRSDAKRQKKREQNRDTDSDSEPDITNVGIYPTKRSLGM